MSGMNVLVMVGFFVLGSLYCYLCIFVRNVGFYNYIWMWFEKLLNVVCGVVYSKNVMKI